MAVAALVGVAVLLAGREMEHWRRLQWGIFWRELRHLAWFNVLAGVLLFYVSFVLRAWRWRVFLSPWRQSATSRIIGPTFIGFTALALIGVAGELTRPYLIAKKEQVSVSSQLSIWMLERLFDIASFAVFLLAAFLFVRLRPSQYLDQFRHVALIILAATCAAALVLLVWRRHGARVEAAVERGLLRFLPRFGAAVAWRLVAFGSALRLVSSRKLALQTGSLSLLMWGLIVAAYHEIMMAFPAPLHAMPLANAPLVIAFAVLGSFVQLPGGATSGLMMIGALKLFHIPGALAISCGITLWLGAYMAPVPVGLLYLRHEHVSLRALSRASADAKTREAANGSQNGAISNATEAAGR